MATKKWVIGNWKLNPVSLNDAKALANALKAHDDAFLHHTGCLSLVVVPSFVHVSVVRAILTDVYVVGVQDVTEHSMSVGAFTGDVSALQAADLGVGLALIGHSERRSYHHENNTILAKKIIHAQQAGLMVVLCVGESQADYQANKTLAVLDEQLAVLADCLAQQVSNNALSIDNLIIAYEPVWAIGTGLVPTLAEVEKVHQHIKVVAQGYLGGSVTVLYGGSVNENNANVFAGSSWVDGVLVGGASLKAESFLAIAKHFAFS